MQSMSTVQLVATLPVLIVVLDYLRRLLRGKRERKGLPFPPGPAGIPLLGNAHAIDLTEPWKTYTKWHAQYGNVLYIKLLDQEVVVLGSQQIAVELLEKRSQIYSDRPYVATLTPFGADCIFAFAQYGDHWRFCRRIFHQSFRSEAAVSFRPMQLRHARCLAMSIVNDPNRYAAHYAVFAAALALSTTYGYEPTVGHDPIVEVIDDYAAALMPAATPEQATLLKLFPFLLHIPDWCPGSSLKKTARRAHSLADKMVEMPYQYTVETMKTSGDQLATSMVAKHLVRMQKQDESEKEEYISALKTAGASAIFASVETTSSTLMTFTLAMVLHPHVWKRAQSEIDAVVGINRLPDYDDRSSLPYVEAVMRETIRWHPSVPLGVWHSTSTSDVYNGYYIREGTTLVANAWAMSRDEARFPNAEAFIPERFLNDDGTLTDNDPADFIFGFGRRICPGRYAADASIWISIAILLATFEFCPSKDSKGQEINIEPKWLNGLTHRPDVFPCDISPRAHTDNSFLERMLAD